MLLALVPLLLLAAPLPAACVPSCEVTGEGLLGFQPPVVVLRSGAAVTWRGLDHAAHVNFEGLTTSNADASCFVARYTDQVTDTVGFRLGGGAVVAEQAGVAKTCATAVPLPEGGALLLYQCVLHPLTMKGALVVLP